MTIAAVYLLHHWVIDVLLGLTYGVASAGAAALIFSGESKHARKEAAVAEAAEHAH